MKKPFIIILALVIGIIATNYLIPEDKTANSEMVEDTVQSSQAAPKQVNGDIPL